MTILIDNNYLYDSLKFNQYPSSIIKTLLKHHDACHDEFNRVFPKTWLNQIQKDQDDKIRLYLIPISSYLRMNFDDQIIKHAYPNTHKLDHTDTLMFLTTDDPSLVIDKLLTQKFRLQVLLAKSETKHAPIVRQLDELATQLAQHSDLVIPLHIYDAMLIQAFPTTDIILDTLKHAVVPYVLDNTTHGRIELEKLLMEIDTNIEQNSTFIAIKESL